MTLDDLVDFEELKQPGSSTLEALGPHFNKRNVNLDVFDRDDGICGWCNLKPVKPPKRKYCSEICVSSAYAFCSSNNNSTKGYLLKKQKFACAGCGESFEDMLLHKAKRYFKRFKEKTVWPPNEPKMTMYRLAYDTGAHFHIDHKIPIHQGGDGIGFDNLQVLCVPCHKRKTLREKLLGG